MVWIDEEQRWLSEAESLNNAQLVVNHFSGSDWTKEALSALLGNMRHESSINPNLYEFGYDWNEDRGFGLVQWTPRSKYWDWAVANGLPPRNGDSQLARLDYEVDNNIQWIANGHALRYGLEDKYDFSFADFRTNTHGLAVESLTEAFMWNYEGPLYSAGEASLAGRIAFARKCLAELDFTGSGGGAIKPHLPVNEGTPLTDRFGWRINPVTFEEEFHNGDDYAGQLNDPIYATMSGTVVASEGNNPLRGNWVMIKHDIDPYYSKYLHLNGRSVGVGDTVSRGQIIGVMGSTGQSTGVHLHFTITTTPEGEVDGGQYIDPQVYLQMTFGGGGSEEGGLQDKLLVLWLSDALNGWKY